jgi:adenosyl cobinamide kinase/adenosyl cobinamide phosphate guanylyltransferase
MPLTLLTGGARSGKSSLAVRLAEESGAPVSLVVTGEARDEEMAERIRLHRESRPAEWTVIEEPVDMERALAEVDPSHTLIVDCLTLWVSNLLEAGVVSEEIAGRARRTAKVCADRAGPTIAITNEVGMGVVPMSALGRRFQDDLGLTNQIWAEAADRTLLMVAGRTLELT